jgi:hypothetical protein
MRTNDKVKTIHLPLNWFSIIEINQMKNFYYIIVINDDFIKVAGKYNSN